MFKFYEISEEDTLALLCHLDTRKATGADHLFTRLRRMVAPGIVRSLATLFNHSLKTGDVPAEWKSATVTPIWKKGDKEMVSNYRPVSKLPIVAKVFESEVQRQHYEYLEANFLLYPAQSGFRSLHRIQDVLLKSVDDWRHALIGQR